MDDLGRIYRNWNEQPLFIDLLPGRYYARNQNLVRTRGLYDPLLSEKDVVIWPVRPTPGINRGYREELRRPDGTVNTYTAAGAPLIYRGDRLPSGLHGNAFVTDSSSNLVHRLIIEDDGNGNVRGRNAYERGEFLASTDERFRPVYTYSAPDGTIYIADMYRGVVQEGQYQTDYLRTYIREHKLETPIGLGRIFRIVHDSTRRDHKPVLSTESSSKLIDFLSHPNGWWRDTAQRLLVERGDQSVAGRLKELVSAAPDERTRLHALWTLDGIDAIDSATVETALRDRSPHVRASAIRVAERWLGDERAPIRAAVLERLADPNWNVRRQLAASLGVLPAESVTGSAEPAREIVLASLLQRFGMDPVTVDAALSGLQGREAAVLERLLQASPHDGPQPEDAVMMLAAAILRSREQPAVQNVLVWATQDDRVEWQRVALLRGFEAALPGDQTGRGGAGGGAGGGRSARGRGSGISLASEPSALIALAAAGRGELSDTAGRVLVRLDWPGKPAPLSGSAADSRPLTPEEEKRVAEGQEVYKTVCIACHQPDGRGLPRVAPSLVESRWVTGAAGLPARIVLHGKEGATGLMPPLGAALSNSQIAAVLTFIRRAWGHEASPVDPYLVQEIRGTNYSRQRPWTDEELSNIAQPNGPGRGGR
jgi:mono/diheme cytochrome c family protein